MSVHLHSELVKGIAVELPQITKQKSNTGDSQSNTEHLRKSAHLETGSWFQMELSEVLTLERVTTSQP